MTKPQARRKHRPSEVRASGLAGHSPAQVAGRVGVGPVGPRLQGLECMLPRGHLGMSELSGPPAHLLLAGGQSPPHGHGGPVTAHYQVWEQYPSIAAARGPHLAWAFSGPLRLPPRATLLVRRVLNGDSGGLTGTITRSQTASGAPGQPLSLPRPETDCFLTISYGDISSLKWEEA